MTSTNEIPAGRKAGGWWRSETGVRTLSAAILAPVVLGVVWLGGWPFTALIAALAALVLLEWLDICGIRRGGGLTTLVGAVATGGAIGATLLSPLAALGLCFALALLMALFAGSRRALAFCGVLYALMPTLALILLRASVAGAALVALVFAVVWATDIFAYLIGRRIGGPKLCPAISPGKTWSGAIGGFLCGVAAGVGVGLVAGSTAPARLMAVSGLLSIVSILGDLFESGLKRRFKVKDAGRLIPGHGGVMDRVDGLIAAAIAAILLGLVLGGGGDPAAGLLGP